MILFKFVRNYSTIIKNIDKVDFLNPKVSKNECEENSRGWLLYINLLFTCHNIKREPTKKKQGNLFFSFRANYIKFK